MFKERIKTHHSAMSSGKKYMIGMSNIKEQLSKENKSGENNATIYIHVPFCKKICSFCNMQRSLVEPSKNYSDEIIREIESYAKMPYIQTTLFDAVYFGGGTPTTLSSEELCNVLKSLKKNLNFTKHAEFTIETTVTELTEEKMERLIQEGVNRFSVGVQTFDTEGRKKMGRIGDGDYAYQRLHQLKKHSNVIVSMDLIYNYPEQTMESLYHDLTLISELELDGFSMYSLINMKQTNIEKAQDEKNDETMFLAIAEYMKKKGYHFLELTKMVKTDTYRYVMNRHQGADTLPLGAGAGGSINNLAMMNPFQLKDYSNSIDQFLERQGMLFSSEYKDIVRFKGDVQTIRMPRFENLYQDYETYCKFREELITHNMIIPKHGEYVLTEKGIFWGNTISRYLFDMI